MLIVVPEVLSAEQVAEAPPEEDELGGLRLVDL